MLNLVIFGAPGSGKGTQGELISKKYNLTHISTGDVLREEIHRDSANGKIAQQYISKGNLVPDELIINILASFLDRLPTPTAGVLFDGFPRTLPQATALNTLLSQRNTQISHVIGLNVPENELIERLLKRGLSSGRSDDNLETIKSRLKVYHAQTQPLQEFYTQEEKFVNINGTGTIEEIFNRIEKEI